MQGRIQDLIRGGPQIVTGLKLPFWGLSFVEFWCWGLIFGGQGGGPGPPGLPPGSAPGMKRFSIYTHLVTLFACIKPQNCCLLTIFFRYLFRLFCETNWDTDVPETQTLERPGPNNLKFTSGVQMAPLPNRSIINVQSTQPTLHPPTVRTIRVLV